MIFRRSLSVFLSVFLFGSVLYSWDAKTRVAVLDLVSRVKTKPVDADTLTELLQKELLLRRAFVLVERAALSKIIEEQKLQMSGIADNDATRIGNLAGASKIITGSLAETSGGGLLLLIKVIDTSSGTIEFMEQEKGRDSDAIENALPAMADRIVRKSRGEMPVKPVPERDKTDRTNENSVTVTEPQPKLPVSLERGPVGIGEKWFPINLVFVRGLQLIPDDFTIIGPAVNILYGYNDTVFGVQAGLINDARVIGGVQAGFVNLNQETLIGVQSGFVGTAGDLYGVQCGFVNIAHKVYGGQFGFFNVTDYLYGIQVGFINIAAHGFFAFMPFINISF